MITNSHSSSYGIFETLFPPPMQVVYTLFPSDASRVRLDYIYDRFGLLTGNPAGGKGGRGGEVVTKFVLE